MSKITHTPEQITRKLRDVEVLLHQGMSINQACRVVGVTEQTYYRWNREYGGLPLEQMKRLKELKNENSHLKKLVADLSLKNYVLKKQIAAKNAVSDAIADSAQSA